MKPKVIVMPKIYPEALERLKEECDVTLFEQLNEDTYPEFLKALTEADGILTAGLKIDQELLEKAPHLKIVSNISVGYDNFDLEEMSKRRVMATNTPDVLNHTVADAVMGLILSTARRIPELDQYVKSGKWEKLLVGEEWFGVDLYGKTLGIIGMGRIGTAVAKRAHLGFDMKILYHNRNRHLEAEKLYDATFCSLDELLMQSDIVCLLVPLTAETKYLIGKREFQLMKETAIFINASRGQTVREVDMITALENRWIAGVGLDVYEQEPVDSHNRLLKLRNVVTLPHMCGATRMTRLNMMNLAITNLIEGLKGETPQNLINQEIYS